MDADKASDFWTSHAKSHPLNLKKMERFESGISEFTTFTDNNSDSGDSTADIMPVRFVFFVVNLIVPYMHKIMILYLLVL